MNCLLKSINTKGEFKNFSCDFSTLDIAFDFLNHIAARGDTLLDVKIIDEDGDLDLPVAAFDGKSFKAPFNELEDQWRAILDKPISLSATDELTQLKNRWHIMQQDQHRHCAWMIETLENQLRLIKNQTTSKRLSEITKRYESALSLYKKTIARHEQLLNNEK